MKNDKNIHENVKVVQNKEGQWGVVDSEGNIIVPYGKYGWIDGFDQGLARVHTHGRTTYTKNIAEMGYVGDDLEAVNSVTDPKEIHQIVLEEKKQNPEAFAKWGIINERGEEVLPLEYDEVWNFFGKNRYSTRVVKNGKNTEVYFHDLNPDLPVRGWKTHPSYHHSEDHDYSNDYPETDYKEETWSAMTDGMYGDHPGPDVDYDSLGF